MPSGFLVAKELAKIFSVISHPNRILIIKELEFQERDVNYLVNMMNISQSRVSQHLSVLRSQNIIEERKEGRKVFYHLVEKKMAEWIFEGLKFLKNDFERKENLISAVEKAEDLWKLKS